MKKNEKRLKIMEECYDLLSSMGCSDSDKDVRLLCIAKSLTENEKDSDSVIQELTKSINVIKEFDLSDLTEDTLKL